MAFAVINAKRCGKPSISAASRHVSITPKRVECVMRFRSKLAGFPVGHSAKRYFGSGVATNGGGTVVAIIDLRPIAINATVYNVVCR